MWEWAVDACVASSVGMGVGDVVEAHAPTLN